MKKHMIVAGIFYLLAIPGIFIIAQSGDFFPSGLIPTGLIVISIPLGMALGPRSGLHSLILKRLSGDRITGLLPGIFHALICGLSIGLLWVIPTHIFAVLSHLQTPRHPLWYMWSMGAVVEEMIFRWGAMSVALFLLWKCFGRKSERPRLLFYCSAMITASLLSTFAHVFNIWSINASVTSPTGMFILGVNMIAGLIFGWTFWKKGFEFSMITHGISHFFIVALSSLL